MFRPVRMCKLNVLLPGTYVTPLTRALGRLGRVHLVDAVSQSEQRLLAGVDRAAEIQDAEALLGRCNALLEALGVGSRSGVGSSPHDRARIVALLDDAETRQRGLAERLEQLLRDSGLLATTAACLRRYPVQDVPVDAIRHLSLLYVVTGRLAPAAVPLARQALGDGAVLLHDEQDPARQGSVLVLTSRHRREAVDAVLTKLGFSGEDLPAGLTASAAQEQQALAPRRAAVQADIAVVRREMDALRSACAGPLLAARAQLQATLAVLRAQQSFGRSRLLYCISGWVPRDQEAAVRRLVDEVTARTGLVELTDADADVRVRGGQEAVPVLFAPSRWLSPFRGLICGFGAPRYDDLDPSLYVAVSFILMFGLMFGDVGQGLAIAALGLWLRRTPRAALAPYRQGGVLLLLCGLSAAGFGFAYGSVFGYENESLLMPLWLSPLRAVTRLLGSAIVVGIVCISLAVVINILNRVHERRWFASVFDKFGVLGILFYWGALGLGLKAARAGELRACQVLLLVILPLALLFIREPLHNLLHQRRLGLSAPFTFVLESCIETMETVTTFLGSTVSFVRLGAFALSHAALCLAVYSTADILRELPGGGLWAVFALVVGNLLVILMEGMVALIQGVRLQYYELFSKYFPGDGTLYSPFTLAEQPLVQDKGDGDR